MFVKRMVDIRSSMDDMDGDVCIHTSIVIITEGGINRLAFYVALCYYMLMAVYGTA
jgi:hypothetical protein